MSNPQLHELMRQFAGMGYAMIGFGPKHPEIPDPELQADIDRFLEENPFLKREQEYVDFLEAYSSAFVIWPDWKPLILIYGFNPGVNVYLPAPDEPLENEAHFFRFSEIAINGEERSAMGFAWDMTANRRQGVYREITERTADKEKTIPYTWYCETFLDWLEAVVTHKGRLFN